VGDERYARCSWMLLKVVCLMVRRDCAGRLLLLLLLLEGRRRRGVRGSHGEQQTRK